MSYIFGIFRQDGTALDEEALAPLAAATEPYAVDGVSLAVQGSMGMGFQPFHTHVRSTLDPQPYIGLDGNMLTFDGRLDNFEDLARQLGLDSKLHGDTGIALAALDRWGEEAFSKFVGDWALALYCRHERALYLARDHAGTRALYYSTRDGNILWSTSLDTFVAVQANSYVDEKYLYRYLCGTSLEDSSPYYGVRSVSAAHYVRFSGGSCAHRRHWSPLIDGATLDRNEAEYDEQFLHLLEQAVQRRTVAGAKILAHLSGGMDSTSIVFVSDSIRRREGRAELLDTLSIYDDSEQSWDDKKYFSIAESYRGKQGIHFDASQYPRTMTPVRLSRFRYSVPGADSSVPEREAGMFHALKPNDYRVILSGAGGDELLGGVPSGLPQLGDALVSGNVVEFVRKGLEWSSPSHPLLYTLSHAISETAMLYTRRSLRVESVPPWVLTKTGYLLRSRPKLQPFGNRPSAILNATTWWRMQETLPHFFPEVLWRPEYRYPFLDRDLVEYLFRVPRHQLTEPSRRRVMMRRALKGIVPTEILERPGKAQVTRKLSRALEIVAANEGWLVRTSPLQKRGIIDVDKFLRALRMTLSGEDARWTLPLLRTAELNLWLMSYESDRTAGFAPVAKELTRSEAGLARTRVSEN